MLYTQDYQPEAMDYYTEPAWASELLAGRERFMGLVYDPACGSGNICKTFAARGHEVLGTDLAEDRPYGQGGVDFLDESWWPSFIDNIVCNPPYGGAKVAEEFCRKALLLAKNKVCMFLPVAYLASSGRHDFFTNPLTQPQRILVLSNRPSCPPGAKLEVGDIKQAGGKTDYMWVVWTTKHATKPTEIHWLSKDNKNA